MELRVTSSRNPSMAASEAWAVRPLMPPRVSVRGSQPFATAPPTSRVRQSGRRAMRHQSTCRERDTMGGSMPAWIRPCGRASGLRELLLWPRRQQPRRARRVRGPPSPPVVSRQSLSRVSSLRVRMRPPVASRDYSLAIAHSGTQASPPFRFSILPMPGKGKWTA